MNRHDPLPVLLDSATRRWPACVRVATALGGTGRFAAVVSRQLLRRARPVCEGWIDTDEADRWFLHHTILLCRATSNAESIGQRDVLISAYDQPTDDYVAFVRAIRTLSFQQREAYVLSACEKLDDRLLAVAMDCSKTAAQTHLDQATKQLRLIAGDSYDKELRRLVRAYHHLTPDDAETRKRVEWLARPIVTKRRFKHAAVIGAIVALLAGAAAVAYLSR